MNSWTRTTIIVIAVSALLTGDASNLLGDEQASTRAQLAERIYEKVEQLQELRNQVVQARQEREPIQQQINRLREDRRQLEFEIETLRANIDTLQADLDRMQEQEDRLESLPLDPLDSVHRYMDNLARRIELGVPYQREQRLFHLSEIEADLEAGDAAERYSAVRSLLVLASEQLRDARSIELLNQPVILPDSRERHAYQMRFGLVGHAFLSEDGRSIGLAAPESDEDWSLDLSIHEQRRLQQGLDILRERAAPRLTLIPFQRSAQNRTELERQHEE